MPGGRPLSATFVRSVSKPGTYGDGRGGHGLTLAVRSRRNGRVAKYWTQRVRLGGKPTMIGLGQYPRTTLAEARRKALENVRAIDRGQDPRGGGIPTFGAASETVIAIRSEGWRPGSRAPAEWRSTLKRQAGPIMSKPVDRITTADVVAVVSPLWHSRPDAARRLRQRISSVMLWAVAQGFRGDDPATASVLAAALGKLGNGGNGTRQHHRAIPHTEIGAAIQAIRSGTSGQSTKLIAEFIIVTAARSGEVRAATWSEIDRGTAIWTIRATRMKGGREHRIPLSAAALDVLDRAADLSDGSGLVFPGSAGRPVNANTLGLMFRQLRLAGTPHGCRSTFRDWCGETGVDRVLAELSLAHSIGNDVEQAYSRSDLLDRRRAVMEAWGEYCSG